MWCRWDYISYLISVKLYHYSAAHTDRRDSWPQAWKKAGSGLTTWCVPTSLSKRLWHANMRLLSLYRGYGWYWQSVVTTWTVMVKWHCKWQNRKKNKTHCFASFVFIPDFKFQSLPSGENSFQKGVGWRFNTEMSKQQKLLNVRLTGDKKGMNIKPNCIYFSEKMTIITEMGTKWRCAPARCSSLYFQHYSWGLDWFFSGISALPFLSTHTVLHFYKTAIMSVTHKKR